MRLISIVLGTASSKARIDGSQALLNYGYRFFSTETLFRANEKIINAKTWKAENDSTSIGIVDDITITLPKGASKRLVYENNLPDNIEGPIISKQKIGSISIKLDDEIINTVPLVALEDNPSGGILKQIQDTIQLWFE